MNDEVPQEVRDAVVAVVKAGMTTATVRMPDDTIIGIDMQGPTYGVAIVCHFIGGEILVESSHSWPLNKA